VADAKQRTKRARVHVLYTGGTIGMVPSDPQNPASPLRPGSKEELQQYLPKELSSLPIDWQVDGLVGVPPLDSSDVNADHWLKMASAIEDRYDDFDGFVILHGTDTMAYTTSGLSFLLTNLAKPVVVTGSQLPLAHPRTDAILNFMNALHVAGYKAVGVPLVPEVVLCFGTRLLRGNRARKTSSSDLEAFDSPNYPALGRLGERIEIDTSLLRPPADNAKAPFFAHKTLFTKVMDFALFPGLRAEPLRAVLDSPDIDGFIMRTFGAGNAMSDPLILKLLERACTGQGGKGKKTILNITQCNRGMVEMGLYVASSTLLEIGVLSGLDMTPEAALAKMFWILATELGGEQQTQLQINQRGEQSEDLFDVRYGECLTPVSAHRVSASPPGGFRKSHLNRAVLRISGLELEDKSASEFRLHVFINLPTATVDTSTEDPHCVAIFEGTDRKPKTQMSDITAHVQRFAEDGKAITITIVEAGGRSFSYSGLYLAIFARVTN
jgi:L-asparaginase